MWHPQLVPMLPRLQLILLVGSYAQNYYLGQKKHRTLTETVRAWQEYLPHYLPIPHPSPRNQLWFRRNPWFSEQVLPFLRNVVQLTLKQD